MIIKLDLESDLYQKIQELVKQEKYSDLYEFVKIAVQNQILEETSESKNITENFEEVSQNFNIKPNEDYKELIEHIKDVSGKNDHIHTSSSNLIWTFYNRFFPTKIIVSTLASITTPEKIWFPLEQVRYESFNFAVSISDKLRRFEEDNDWGRNKKLSTGLPLPESEVNGLKGKKRKDKLLKITASQMRFKEQFVGRFVKKDKSFKGACFELGLVRIKIVKDTCLMRLSRLGVEFASLDNPILTNEKFDVTFSEKETKFIQNKIFPKFKLEEIIVKRILNELKRKKLSSDDIDEIYQNEWINFEKQKGKITRKDSKTLDTSVKNKLSLTSERVATMGRLSELKLVHWDIVGGKSIYSLGKFI
jgi:metal-responsive CopG/Arc/MetJ family transcriptional regulator